MDINNKSIEEIVRKVLEDMTGGAKSAPAPAASVSGGAIPQGREASGSIRLPGETPSAVRSSAMPGNRVRC